MSIPVIRILVFRRSDFWEVCFTGFTAFFRNMRHFCLSLFQLFSFPWETNNFLSIYIVLEKPHYEAFGCAHTILAIMWIRESFGRRNRCNSLLVYVLSSNLLFILSKSFSSRTGANENKLYCFQSSPVDSSKSISGL